jgi:putative ABC transport system substrate-binding protein
MVDSLARPGGNITGVTTLTQGLNAKRLQLLHEVLPQLSRVAVLWTPDDSAATTYFKEYEAAARAMNVQLQSLQVRPEDPDVEEAFQSAVNARADALIAITTAQLFLRRRRVADLALKNHLPTIFHGSAWVESGGLMSYSTNDIESFRHAATYVDKILKGTRPADLPVEQLAIFELAINLVTAKAIGVAIPHSLVLRADRVLQ